AVAEAYGGLRELVGEPDRPPARVGVSIGDSIAGLYAAFGVMMTLFQRESARAAGRQGPSPVSQHIDVALHEAVFSMMESLVPDHSAYGVRRERVGGRMEGIAPTNAYPCADGSYVVIAGNNDAIFQRDMKTIGRPDLAAAPGLAPNARRWARRAEPDRALTAAAPSLPRAAGSYVGIAGNSDASFKRYMKTIGRPDLADDPGLATNAQRWARRDELDDAITAWTTSLPRADVLRILDSAGVPAGPIMSAADITDDPQFRARAMIQQLPVEVDGEEREVAFPGIVPLLGGTSLPVRSVGPDLGEHNEEVLCGLLGWTRED